ncbi:hypothetical protein NPIL_166951, partial [Nephila pilipes]
PSEYSNLRSIFFKRKYVKDNIKRIIAALKKSIEFHEKKSGPNISVQIYKPF